jgi:hypothetical protein
MIPFTRRLARQVTQLMPDSFQKYLKPAQEGVLKAKDVMYSQATGTDPKSSSTRNDQEQEPNVGSKNANDQQKKKDEKKEAMQDDPQRMKRGYA